MATLPALFEQLKIPHRINAIPKPVVAVGSQLSVLGETLERFLLKHGLIPLNVIPHFNNEAQPL